MNQPAQPEIQSDLEGLTRAKFDELQFLTLRKEIEETKGRLFLLTIGGAALIPAAKLFTSTKELEAITVLLPLLVGVLVLIFLSENNALMRAGSYILHYIENPLYRYTVAQEDPRRVGWERYLQGGKRLRTRLVDTLAVWAFLLYALSYYLVTVYLVICWAMAQSPWLAPMLGGAYVTLFFGMMFVVWCCFRSNTEPRFSDIKDH